VDRVPRILQRYPQGPTDVPIVVHDKHMWGVYCCLMWRWAQTWKSEQSCRSSPVPLLASAWFAARFLFRCPVPCLPHQPAGECFGRRGAAQCAPTAGWCSFKSVTLGTGWRVYELRCLPYWQAEYEAAVAPSIWSPWESSVSFRVSTQYNMNPQSLDSYFTMRRVERILVFSEEQRRSHDS